MILLEMILKLKQMKHLPDCQMKTFSLCLGYKFVYIVFMTTVRHMSLVLDKFVSMLQH